MASVSNLGIDFIDSPQRAPSPQRLAVLRGLYGLGVLCGDPLPSRQPGRRPGVEPAVDVGDALQAQFLQDTGGQARRVALGTDDHDRLIVRGHLREPVRASWIEPPLEHVALDDQRAGNLAFAPALLA